MKESFLFLCKQSYFEGVTPSNKRSRNKEIYKRLVAIAKQYFDSDKYDDFAGYFIEGQYLISLWTAHMLIEYGSPSEDLKKVAINTIKEYSDNPLAPEVAIEEKEWLKQNEDKYRW